MASSFDQSAPSGWDYIKSTPRGLAQGFGDLVSTGMRMMDPDTATGLSQAGIDPFAMSQQAGAQTDNAVAKAIDYLQNKTGFLPQPADTAGGRTGYAIGRIFGNPLTWFGGAQFMPEKLLFTKVGMDPAFASAMMDTLRALRPFAQRYLGSLSNPQIPDVPGLLSPAAVAGAQGVEQQRSAAPVQGGAQ